MGREHQKAVIFLLITTLLWSAGGLLIKMVSWNPIAIAGARSIIAALMLFFIIRKPKLKLTVPYIGGIVMYTLTVILFVSSTKMTTAANAILLQYTAPIYVAIFGYWILKERAKFIDWIAIVVVLGGMVLFFIDDLSGGSLLGNILAIISGITFAFMIMFMRKEQGNNSTIEVAFWGNVLTAIICSPFIVGQVPDGKSILGIVLLGVFQLGLAYYFYGKALKHIKALEAVLIQVIEPLLNPIWVLLFIGEKPSFWSVIGGLVVLSAVVGRGIAGALMDKRQLDKGTLVG